MQVHIAGDRQAVPIPKRLQAIFARRSLGLAEIKLDFAVLFDCCRHLKGWAALRGRQLPGAQPRDGFGTLVRMHRDNGLRADGEVRGRGHGQLRFRQFRQPVSPKVSDSRAGLGGLTLGAEAEAAAGGLRRLRNAGLKFRLRKEHGAHVLK